MYTAFGKLQKRQDQKSSVPSEQHAKPQSDTPSMSIKYAMQNRIRRVLLCDGHAVECCQTRASHVTACLTGESTAFGPRLRRQPRPSRGTLPNIGVLATSAQQSTTLCDRTIDRKRLVVRSECRSLGDTVRIVRDFGVSWWGRVDAAVMNLGIANTNASNWCACNRRLQLFDNMVEETVVRHPGILRCLLRSARKYAHVILRGMSTH